MKRTVPFGLGFLAAILLFIIVPRFLQGLASETYDFKQIEALIRSGEFSNGDPLLDAGLLAKPQGGGAWQADDGTRFGIWQYAHGERELWLYVRTAPGEVDEVIIAAQILDRSKQRRSYRPSSIEWLFADPEAMKELAPLLNNSAKR